MQGHGVCLCATDVEFLWQLSFISDPMPLLKQTLLLSQHKLCTQSYQVPWAYFKRECFETHHPMLRHVWVHCSTTSWFGLCWCWEKHKPHQTVSQLYLNLDALKIFFFFFNVSDVKHFRFENSSIIFFIVLSSIRLSSPTLWFIQ